MNPLYIYIHPGVTMKISSAMNKNSDNSTVISGKKCKWLQCPSYNKNKKLGKGVNRDTGDKLKVDSSIES